MKSKFPESNLILAGLSMIIALGGVVANNGLSGLLTSLPYGHLIVAVITGLSVISTAVYAQLSTPVTVPSAVKTLPVTDSIDIESAAAKAKVEAVEAVSKAIASIPEPIPVVKTPNHQITIPLTKI